MNPGELRHRITIQKLNITISENNVEEQLWQEYINCWAKIENLYGREFFAALAAQAEKTVKFTIRYLKNIDSNMRILFNEKQYNIILIDNIKYQNKYMEIKAVEALQIPCIVYRNTVTKDDFNRPLQSLAKIGSYPCTITRKGTGYTRGIPNATTQETYMLAGPVNMNVQAGDIVEIASIKYIASTPYRPNNYFTEVEVVVNKDV